MKCAICNSPELTLITDRIRNSSGEVFYCASCDLAMLSPRFADAGVYYSEDYRREHRDDLEAPSTDAEAMYRLRTKYQTDRLEIMRPYLVPTKSLLEIGCSAGQFLSHVIGQLKRCDGIELDPSCAEFVRRTLGAHVYQMPFEKCPIDNRSYDYVAAFQVLEHALDPVLFLSRARDILCDQGKIFIEIPNLYDPLLRLWDIGSYQRFFYHEAHLFYFSKKSLAALAEKCGLVIEKLFFVQDYSLFNHLFWFFNHGPQSSCDFGLSEPRIPFLDENVGERLNILFKDYDRRYKKILSETEYTANVFAVLSRR